VESTTVDEPVGETVTDPEAHTELLTVVDPEEETFAEVEALEVAKADRVVDGDFAPEKDLSVLKLALLDNEGPVDAVRFTVEELEKALLGDADADGEVMATARIR
jgi:hypothetical protein